MCQPWTNVAKTHHKTSDPKIFISHIPFLNSAGAALHITPRMCANPSWTNVPRHTTNFNLKIFISHIPVLEQTPRMFANPEPTFQRYTTKPQTLRFSSHTSVLNFAGAAFHITPRMCANPSWTNVPRHTTNFRSEFFHLTHPCFEFCRNSLPCYTTHVSQPILYQRPEIQHTRLMTQFCKSILIQPPKIHLSKFQCSPYRRQKCRALQEDMVEWKPVCNLQAKKGSQ